MDACSPEAPSSCTPWWHNVSFLLQRRGCSTCGNSLVSRPVPRTATPELVETTGSFPHPPRWWSNFQTRSGKISSPNTSISLAFRRQWKDVRRNFFFFFQLCVTGWHRGVWPHRFSVKNKHSGATCCFYVYAYADGSLIQMIYRWLHLYKSLLLLAGLIYAISLVQLICRVH